MSDHSGDTVTGQRPDIKNVLEEFAASGKRWAAAELRLARLEAVEAKTRASKIVVVAGIGFAAAFCFLSALTQAGIFFLTPVLGNAGFAAVAAAAVLGLLILACALVIRSAVRFEGESMLFRWLSVRPQGLPR